MSECTSQPRAACGPAKGEVPELLRLFLGDVPQLVHREAGAARLTDQGFAGDGVRPIELAAAPVERQPLAVAALIDSITGQSSGTS
jgi:hypothetical protein